MWRTAPTIHEPRSTVPEDQAAMQPSLALAHAPPPAPQVAAGLPSGTVCTPDLRGMAASDARRIGRMSDLRVDVSTRTTDEALWDRVVSQDPDPGVSLAAGDMVTITVGQRPSVLVPDVRGGEEAESLAVLREAGLRLGRRVVRRSDDVPDGHVVRTRPRPGTAVLYGTSVSYVVATPRTSDRKRAHRHERRVHVRRLPDGSFLSLPIED